MRKNKCKVILALLFAAVLCISVLAPVKTYAVDPVYVALGDSIPAGYGLSNKKDSYPSLVGKEIRYGLYNHSHSGDTTSDLIAKLKESGVKSRLSQASLVTISIGGNDLMGDFENILNLLYGPNEVIEGIYATSIANMRQICATVISLVPKNCIILFENIYNPYGSMGSLGALIGQRISRQNQQIKTVCDEYQRIHYVDVTSMNSNPENFNAGSGMTLAEMLDCHPTQQGHRVLADLIKAAFYEAGGKDNLPVTTQAVTYATTTVYQTTQIQTQVVYTTYIAPPESTSYIAPPESTSFTTEETTIVTTEATTEVTTEETTTTTQHLTTEEIITETTILETTRVEETVNTQELITNLETIIPISTESSKETTIETSTDEIADVTTEQTTEITTELITESETKEQNSGGKTNVVLVIVGLVGGIAVLVGAYFLMYNIFKYLLMKRKESTTR